MGDGVLGRGLESAQAEPRAARLWFAGSLREATNRNAIMNPSPTHQSIKYVGLDVHAQTVAVAIAQQGGDVLSYGTPPFQRERRRANKTPLREGRGVVSRRAARGKPGGPAPPREWSPAFATAPERAAPDPPERAPPKDAGPARATPPRTQKQFTRKPTRQRKDPVSSPGSFNHQ